MVKKGAALARTDRHSGRIPVGVLYSGQDHVNTASSQDLQTGLQLSAANADAIVAFRKANGNFKDLSALGKVTGLDSKKLEAKKDLTEF